MEQEPDKETETRMDANGIRGAEAGKNLREKLEELLTNQTWFLLLEGSSCDGRGRPSYKSRTFNKSVAKEHYYNCQKSPYNVGGVEVITATKRFIVSLQTDWSEL